MTRGQTFYDKLPRVSEMVPPPRSEGFVAKAIEEQTSRIPSDIFLWAAGGSIAVSMYLHCSGKKEEAQFIGFWAPTLLILGLYNKLVKVAGSENSKHF